MRVHLSLSSLGNSRWYEYFIRFVLGGAATALAGVLSLVWGASVGGLFLALPAIFCASATLIEAHEIRRKREAGLNGERRGREAAALDAAGTGLGSLALIGFAFTFFTVSRFGAVAAFVSASIVWILLAIGSWQLWAALKSQLRGWKS